MNTTNGDIKKAGIRGLNIGESRDIGKLPSATAYMNAML
jgi:hypothetical protein